MDKEVFRNSLLKILDGNRARYGLGVMALQANLIRFGVTAAQEAEVLDGVGYLTEKGLIEEVPRLVNRENRTWRITTRGIAYIDENNL
jgi:hypothetical protein